MRRPSLRHPFEVDVSCLLAASFAKLAGKARRPDDATCGPALAAALGVIGGFNGAAYVSGRYAHGGEDQTVASCSDLTWFHEPPNQEDVAGGCFPRDGRQRHTLGWI